jgi:tryptophan-rich sensory protein
MPDDNRVVWDFIEPNVPGGSVTAPFQFSLYSQIGVTGALILSCIVGFFIGRAWCLLIYQQVEFMLGSLLGALIVLLSIHIAIDSLRHSLVSSYGMVWGGVFVGFAWLISRLITRLNGPKIFQNIEEK